MSHLELERVNRQNQKNKGKIKEQNTVIDCLKNDLQTQVQLIMRQKTELEQLKHQIKIMKRKLEEEQMEKERVESRYLLVLQNLQGELEDYKKKYNKLQNKIFPLMDQDSVRLKVLNQVESNHQLELSKLKNTIQTLKDQILNYRRENQVLKHSLENQRLNRDEQVRRVKSNKNNGFAQDTIDYLTFSMWKDMQAKLKTSYEQARKQAQFYKEKYFASQKKYHTKILMTDRDNQQQFSANRYR